MGHYRRFLAATAVLDSPDNEKDILISAELLTKQMHAKKTKSKDKNKTKSPKGSPKVSPKVSLCNLHHQRPQARGGVKSVETEPRCVTKL